MPQIPRFTVTLPLLRLRLAWPFQPAMPVAAGSSFTNVTSGRWKYRCSAFCRRVMASVDPCTALPAMPPCSTHVRPRSRK